MSVIWPTFTFPFPPDMKAVRKAQKKAQPSRAYRYESGPWATQAHKDLELFLANNATNEFTSEDFKIWCLEILGRPKPHHGSVWGAIWMTAVKRGKIEKVGVRMVSSVTYKDRHLRKSMIWKRRYK